MSLEAALAENTAALKELIALTAEANKARSEAMAHIAAGDSETARGPGRARKPKPETEEVKPKPEAEKQKPTATESAHPTPEALREAATKFSKISDVVEKPKRRDFIRAVIEELGIPNREDGKSYIVDAAPEDRQKVIDWMADFADGKKVNFQADSAAEDDDDIG